ncbi:hypothetical protein [Leptospira kanakyensis]|uniref:hypothetical protein n=1 Tax=Leptospira kanakyensis TaxID=2484968 RepID=UPI00223CB788|nr:hypothetical protein [Leptospira kanakyensis]MCW7471728.1 hypothetical protein [Leptospira kanakyensis]
MFFKKSNKIPNHQEKDFKETKRILNDFLHYLLYAILNTSRDSRFPNNHLISFLYQEITETLVGIEILIKEGIHTTAIRESRFLLELLIKVAYLQQKDYNLSIEDKLTKYNKMINDPSISKMKEIELYFLEPDIRREFIEKTGRLYGEASTFVHTSVKSIGYRKDRLTNESDMGRESTKDLINLNNFLREIFASCLVFLNHSLPQYVVGDFHASSEKKTKEWYYFKSKYIASIDKYFDYKHERKSMLSMIEKERSESIEF